MVAVFWIKLYVLGSLLVFWLMFLGLRRSLLWATFFLLAVVVWSELFFQPIAPYFLFALALELWVMFLVYQEELRCFFKHNSSKLPAYSSIAKEVEEFLEFALKNNLSGILVFKRRGDLEAFKRTGELIRTKVDALVLSQFFAPDTLFKSRAVIIEGDEVTAVNCVLPKDGPRYLDKLDQSGFALSQITDALVVVFDKGRVNIFLEGSRAKTTPQRVGAILKTLRSGRKIKIV